MTGKEVLQDLRSHFRGCLLGGAVGDALGAAVEFMDRDEILRRFGADGITAYAPAYGGLGTITDDTQMTLFTAEGLLRGWLRGCTKGVADYPSVVANAYQRWLRTQGERAPLEAGAEAPGWLFQHPALHSRRAPGNTCLTALQEAAMLGERASNNSKGCGPGCRSSASGVPCHCHAQRSAHHRGPSFPCPLDKGADARPASGRRTRRLVWQPSMKPV